MYNPKNSIEGEDRTQLPKDTILDGVITQIQDGKVKDFVRNLDKWEGDAEAPAISLEIEIKAKDEIVKLEQVFTYKEQDGKTVYTPKSNLGKFKLKYGKLPEAGVKVKIITNNEGYGKVKLD